MFELLAQDRQTKARRRPVATVDGTVDTPAFMPIGTQGTVKTIRKELFCAFDCAIRANSRNVRTSQKRIAGRRVAHNLLLAQYEDWFCSN
jgi:tRNA-guanine family transglycosylase